MGRRDELASRTRADLLEAAKRLFAERGYPGTKVTDIAAAADRAVGSFYSHFSDKEQLLAVLRSELGDPGQGGDSVREHITACWTALRTHRPTAIALLQSAIAAAPDSGRFRDELAGWTAPLRRHLENRRDRGEPLPGDPGLVAAAVGLTLAGLNLALPADDGRVADAVADLLCHGLHGPGAASPHRQDGGRDDGPSPTEPPREAPEASRVRGRAAAGDGVSGRRPSG